MFLYNFLHKPTLAQLVERRTVVDADQSLGRWFESGRSDNFFVNFSLIFLSFSNETMNYSYLLCLFHFNINKPFCLAQTWGLKATKSASRAQNAQRVDWFLLHVDTKQGSFANGDGRRIHGSHPGSLVPCVTVGFSFHWPPDAYGLRLVHREMHMHDSVNNHRIHLTNICKLVVVLMRSSC